MKLNDYKRGRHFAVLACGVGMLADPHTAMCLEPRDLFAFNVGPVVVKPSLQLMGQYDDNLFYLPQPRIDDYLFLLRPGVDFRVGSMDTQHRFTVGYDLTSRFYAENTDQDSTDQYFSLDASLNWTKFRFAANAGLQYLTGILGGYEASENGVFIPVGKTDRLYVPISATATYALSEKTETYVRGDLRLTDYTSTGAVPALFPYYDLFQWKAYGGATYKVTPKTRALAEGFYGQWTSEPNSPRQPPNDDAEGTGASVGATGQIFSKLTGTAKVGFQSLWAESADADRTIPTGEISFSTPVTQKISATLGYRHDVSVSPQGTSVQGDPTRRTLLAYVQDSINAGVTGRFGAAHPLTVGITGSYILNDYVSSGVSRSGEFYRVGVNVGYQVKLWMNVGASYEYGSQTYNGTGSLDYDYNRVSIFASFGL